MVRVPNLLDGAFSHHHAVIDEKRVVDDLQGLGNVVGDHHGGQAQGVIEAADDVGDGIQGDGVQAGKGLVVHDQHGIQCNGPGQSHTPGHATG